MNKKMQDIKDEIIEIIKKDFNPEGIEFVFSGMPITKESFADAVLTEFIVNAYQKSEKKQTLRHYIPYGKKYLENEEHGISSENQRKQYGRTIKYTQTFRDEDYEIMKEFFGTEINELIGTEFSSMEEKIKGYALTPENILEINNMMSLGIIRALMDGRLEDVKKVSNETFRSYMEDYDAYINKLQKGTQGDDNEEVFSEVAFYQLEAHFSIELIYTEAKRMDELKVSSIPDDQCLRMLCAPGSRSAVLAGGPFFSTNSIVKERQKMIPYAIDGAPDLSENCHTLLGNYYELIVLHAWFNDERCCRHGMPMFEYFSESTQVEDWASFFRDYDLFTIWHKKDLTNKIIRNMRYLYKILYPNWNKC